MAAAAMSSPPLMGKAPTETGSVAGGTSGTHTLSISGSDDGHGFTSTELLGGLAEGEDIHTVLDRWETLQFQQRSPQQPNSELDKDIAQTFSVKPEWRSRMAVMTKSPWLRKKILKADMGVIRICGSSSLGTSHPWRQERLPQEFTDHNWPRVSLSKSGEYHLPGGTAKHHRLLRAPVDKIRVNPVLSSSPNYSVPRASRFPGTVEGSGELRKKEGTPGPGTYFKTIPRGVAFPTDGGETSVFGANHVCPWKGSLGHQINPVDVDHSVLTSQPKWSFPKTRRAISETSLGHRGQDGGAVKTDSGCLSPGPVYEHYSSFRSNSGRAFSLKPRVSRSLTAGRTKRVRCVPVDPAPGDQLEGDANSQATDASGSRQARCR